jgi:hypothetical protein
MKPHGSICSLCARYLGRDSRGKYLPGHCEKTPRPDQGHCEFPVSRWEPKA